MDDVDALRDEVYGAFVQTTIANATIVDIDKSEALVKILDRYFFI